jgi:hypothetical protein
MPAKMAADDSQNFQVSNDGFKVDSPLGFLQGRKLPDRILCLT